MGPKSTFLDVVFDGVSKIKEGFEQVEAEQKRLKEMTAGSDEACIHFGISKPTLIKRRNLNLIPYIRIGNEYRYFIKEKGEVCTSK